MEEKAKVIPKERNSSSITNKILEFMMLFVGYLIAKSHFLAHINVTYFIYTKISLCLQHLK